MVLRVTEPTHDVMIVPMSDLADREVFSIECSCGFTVRRYTSRDAAKAGGAKHVERHSR